jgi:hypothetical protein
LACVSIELIVPMTMPLGKRAPKPEVKTTSPTENVGPCGMKWCGSGTSRSRSPRR